MEEATEKQLHAVFLSFVARAAGSTGELDGSKFSKFARDCKVLSKKVTATDVDIVFAKVKPKGERRITYPLFKTAVAELGKIRYPDEDAATAFDKLVQHVLSHGGPAFHGTKAVTSGVYGKLVDTSKYTGAHKERFGADGRGKGKAGRVDNDRCDDLSQITRPALHATHTDPLAAAEAAEAAMRAQFGRFDKDSSGFLDHDEVASLLSTLGFADADVAAEFEVADANADGKIDFSEFVTFYNILIDRQHGETKKKVSARRHRSAASSGAGAGAGAGVSAGVVSKAGATPLENTYLAFCRYGGNPYETEIDNVKFAKMARDCGWISKKCTKTDIDLVFTSSKTKGARKLRYAEFKTAVGKVGAKLFPRASKEDQYAKASELAVSHGGPSTHGTTADTGGIYGKLTDRKLYTGAHKGKA